MKPFVKRVDGSWEDLKLHVAECGANNYFFENNTIHFVVRGDCVVRVRLINSVFVTLRLEVDYATFFDDNKSEDFIKKVIAFLDIDPSRIKIVGHKKGSVILTTSIESATPIGATDASGNAYNPAAESTTLMNMATKLSDGFTNDQAFKS